MSCRSIAARTAKLGLCTARPACQALLPPARAPRSRRGCQTLRPAPRSNRALASPGRREVVSRSFIKTLFVGKTRRGEVSAPDEAMSDAPVSPAEVEKARDAWVKAVSNLSVDDTVALYDPVIGKLLGTVDLKDVRTGSAAIRQYFEGFLSHEKIVPLFPEKVTDADLIQLGGGSVAFNGYYAFMLTRDSLQKKANAKFTYIYKRGPGGDLKILLHNSGLTPGGIEDAPSS